MRQEIKDRIEKIKKGEVPEGYKMIKNKVIPSEWVFDKIMNLVKRVRKPVSVELDQEYRQIGIRSHGKGIFYKDVVSGEQLGNKAVFWIEPDCFIVNIVFAWEMAVAKTTVNEKGMIASHRFPMYKPISGLLNVDYFTYYFKSHQGKNLLELASPGGAGRNKTLGQTEFLELSIPTPSVPEQQIIATILSTWDKAIELKEKLIEQKKEQKRGLMKKLLTGEVRLPGFEGEWKEVELGDIVQKVIDNRGKTPPTITSKGYELIEVNALEGENVYPNYQKISKFVEQETYRNWFRKGHPEKGDILIATVGSVGSSVIMNSNRGSIAQNIIGLRIHKRFHNEFVFWMINSSFFDDHIRAVTMGAVQPSIKVPHLLKFKFNVPGYEEMIKISQILITINREIELMISEIEALKQQKKGLMQLLLTGIVRTIHN